MIVQHLCTCGLFLRFSNRRRRYEPLSGSGAPMSGHVAAFAVIDGVQKRVSEAQCSAPRRLADARKVVPPLG